MLRYFGKRLLAFVPTLFLISAIAFGLSRMTPGDPVDCGGDEDSELALGSAVEHQQSKRNYQRKAIAKGLDKPYFYFSLTAAAYPDTLARILDRFERKSLQKLIAQYGNWPQISAYYQQLEALETTFYALPKDQARDPQILLLRDLLQLRIAYKGDNIRSLLQSMEQTTRSDSLLQSEFLPSLSASRQAFQSVEDQATPNRLMIPKLYWHGTNNQYHFWFSNFLCGDFGLSCRNNQPVFDRLRSPLWWTLVMTIPSLLLAFLISVPIGLYGAIHRDSWFDRISTIVLFILFSLPTFWVATMLIVFFTTKEYGAYMDIFPTVGLGELPSDAPLWDRFWETTSHLMLPIFCMTYVNLAFISRQMRNGALQVLQTPFIRTARAKGLTERKVVWKHLLRNALFPLITIIAMVLPQPDCRLGGD